MQAPLRVLAYVVSLAVHVFAQFRNALRKALNPKTQSDENSQFVTPVWIVSHSQWSWQVSARAVIRSGVGLVSDVDRSPALRLLWVLSALSVPAAPPSCAHRHVARLTSRRPCCSLQQVSTAQLPLNPARLQGVRRRALPPAQLTSAQLTCFRLSLAHLSSAHLRLGPSAGRPHLVSPLA